MNGLRLKSDFAYRKLASDDPEDPFFREKEPTGFPYGKLSSWHLIRIPFRHFIRMVIALPLGAFLFGVFWALHVDFEKATYVVCSREHNRPIKNYLPSLSAAIGDFSFSQLVWKICIVVHAPGRFLFAAMYLRYLKNVLRPQYSFLAVVACGLHVIENIGLLGLTLVTSKKNLLIHATNFAIFIIASEIYMVLLCILLSKCRDTGEMNKLEVKSLKVKILLCKVAIFCSILLFVAYFRHEAYCETGVYSIFAGLEYIVVLANIGFHGSAYWDFYDRIVIIDFLQPCKMPVYKLSWEY